MKEWLTAREIAEAGLDGLPQTERGIQLRAEREGWDAHPTMVRRTDRGGGNAYHFRLLPLVAQVDWRQRHIVIEERLSPPPADAPQPPTDRVALERDVRMAILNAWTEWGRGLGLSKASNAVVFVDRYNAGLIKVPDWVRNAVGTLSRRTLLRWKAASAKGEAIGFDPAAARKGKGLIEIANDGAVQAFVLALIAKQPHLSAEAVRDQCRSEFGDELTAPGGELRPMPPVRTFQDALKRLKTTHKVALTKLTDPDKFRSHYALSGVGAMSHATEPNRLWQIDASPADMLCTDGRHALYACIDIATRRTIWQQSKTPRASAVALLIRKAILAWGVPEEIMTDNGSDFVARDTERLFASLSIKPHVAEAYSPEQKGHVERAIKTMQHGLMPLLPGYVGHSVADRKAIEGRKSFAARMGSDDRELFEVKLTAADLQHHIDDWAALKYARRPHEGLGRRTPEDVAAAAAHKRRTVDERALDLLLMPVAGGDGVRVVGKRGLKIDGNYYLLPHQLPGTRVLARMDPLDMGKVYAFAADGGQYLGEAICAALSGLHPQTLVRAAKEIQREVVDEATRSIRRDMKRLAKGPSLIERALDVARRDEPKVVPLPRPAVRHETPQIAAALEAMTPRRPEPATPQLDEARRRLAAQMEVEQEARLRDSAEARFAAFQAQAEADRTAHLPAGDKVIPLPESPKQRYRRLLDTRLKIEAGTASADEITWVARYEMSVEYRGQARMHEEFGEAYLS